MIVVEIGYRNKKLERICTDVGYAIKQHGEEMAIKIHYRIDQIRSAENIGMLIRSGFGRCHELNGKRKETYAMDLVHPFRLVFMKSSQSEIQIIILTIEDYH